jgi:hypothetical protein
MYAAHKKFWSATPSSGTVSPNSSVNVSITLNASGLKPASYTDTIYIHSNDSTKPVIRIPVSLVVIDSMPIVVNAGDNDTICENATYKLSGTGENYKSVVWRSSGDGAFDDSASLTATYTPGKNDIAAGKVDLTLKGYALMSCGTNATDTMTLFIQKNPTVIAGANDTICENSTYTLSGTATNQKSVVWETSGDGTFNNTALLNATYTPGANDKKNGNVTLILSANALLPCGTNTSSTVTLLIWKNSEKPATPSGVQTIMLGQDETSAYATTKSKGAEYYLWHLAPSPDAGDISGNGTSATVTWNKNFTKTEAYVFVEAGNKICGATSSDSLVIHISPVGIPNHSKSESGIVIAPNPSQGSFKITIEHPKGGLELYILNLSGKVIRHMKLLNSPSKKFEKTIHLTNYTPGIYYLKFVSAHSSEVKKVIIR